MANSGWLRIKTPGPGVVVQTFTISGQVYSSPCALGVATDTAVFSSWVRNFPIRVDTVFTLINHGTSDVVVGLKWFAADGSLIQDTQVTVPVNNMKQAPASAYV